MVGSLRARLLPEMVDDEYDCDIDVDSNNEEGDTNRSEDMESASEEG
jgi:hypothetical protein